jgi:hypothetical protein
LTARAQAVLVAGPARHGRAWAAWDIARRNPRILIGGSLVL